MDTWFQSQTIEPRWEETSPASHQLSRMFQLHNYLYLSWVFVTSWSQSVGPPLSCFYDLLHFPCVLLIFQTPTCFFFPTSQNISVDEDFSQLVVDSECCVVSPLTIRLHVWAAWLSITHDMLSVSRGEVIYFPPEVTADDVRAFKRKTHSNRSMGRKPKNFSCS